MAEPVCSRLRPIVMVRAFARSALPAVVALIVTGCGSSQPSSDGGSDAADPTGPASPTASADVGQCPAGSPALADAPTLAIVDLDGDGGGEEVRLTARDSECAGMLFAEGNGGYVSARVEAESPPVTEAYAVEVSGRDGQLLVTRQEHPRGGFQLRLYGLGDDGLAEMKVQGRSLVPFVARDVQERPLSVECTDGGVVLTEAVAHEPPGVIFAWDIMRTTYDLDGTEVSAGPTREIDDNVLPQEIDREYPELVRYDAFTGCRVPTAD